MDREDAKEYLVSAIALQKLMIKHLVAYQLGHWSLLIGKFYTSLIIKLVNKPKLFRVFGLRWCVWMSRTNYWFDRCEAIRTEAKELEDTLHSIERFYRLDM